jgi:hypothetical protein
LIAAHHRPPSLRETPGRVEATQAVKEFVEQEK